MADRIITDAAHRFADMTGVSHTWLDLLVSINKEPLASLEKATKPLERIVPRVATCVHIVKERANNPADGLAVDESAAIALYTVEFITHTDSLYYMLDAALRTGDRGKIKPWFQYLRLLLTALDKPPSVKTTMYGAMRLTELRKYDMYQEGKSVVWRGFSSWSTSETIIAKEQLQFGQSGRTCMFAIDYFTAKDLHSYAFLIQTRKRNLVITSYPRASYKTRRSRE